MTPNTPPSAPLPPDVEPWLRGSIPDVHPAFAPLLHSFTQVSEDLARFTAGLSTEQVWKPIATVPALGFQLRHIAGSVDRLVTYLCGDQLSAEQIAALKAESTPGATLDTLLAEVDASLNAAAERVKAIPPDSLLDPRYVGKKRLPTSVIGLMVHVAEHTQRHLGQAITTAKLVRDSAA